LTRTNSNNNWNNVVNASLDVNDDGKMNGSQGTAFVQSHDDFGPAIDNVAFAYMLMKPGDAIVYFNAKEFGNNRSFPKSGRADTLVVRSDGTVNARFLRNSSNNKYTGRGYLIYGLQTPQGTLSLTNVNSTITDEAQTADTNDTARISKIDVIKSNAFNVNLHT